MAGEASEAVTRRTRTPPIRLGDPSIPGDRTHPGGRTRRRTGRRRRRFSLHGLDRRLSRRLGSQNEAHGGAKPQTRPS